MVCKSHFVLHHACVCANVMFVWDVEKHVLKCVWISNIKARREKVLIRVKP